MVLHSLDVPLRGGAESGNRLMVANVNWLKVRADFDAFVEASGTPVEFRLRTGEVFTLRCVARFPVKMAATPGARLRSWFWFVEPLRTKLKPTEGRSTRVWLSTTSTPRFLMLPTFSSRVATPATDGAIWRAMIASRVFLL